MKTTPTQDTGRAVTRRSVAKGAAWTIPVVTIAAAAPSLAASPVETTVTGRADKCPGASDVPGGFPKQGYRVVLTIEPEPTSVVVSKVVLGNNKEAAIVTQPIRTPEGWEFIVDANSSPSSLTVTVVVDGVTFAVPMDAYPRCD